MQLEFDNIFPCEGMRCWKGQDERFVNQLLFPIQYPPESRLAWGRLLASYQSHQCRECRRATNTQDSDTRRQATAGKREDRICRDTHPGCLDRKAKSARPGRALFSRESG